MIDYNDDIFGKNNVSSNTRIEKILIEAISYFKLGS